MKSIRFGILILCLVLSLAIANNALAASFQNGTFDTDFEGWSGEVVNNQSIIVDPDNDSSHFSITAGIAQIQNDNTYWLVSLYQTFDLDPLLGPGYTMDISFWIQWNPTDSNIDGLSVTLGDPSGQQDLLFGIPTADLLTGTTVTQDITSWAGQNVTLIFSVWDWNWNTSDILKIDNITITQKPVPEPTSILLLGIGLCGVCLMMKKEIVFRH